jgi:hypothetical protein
MKTLCMPLLLVALLGCQSTNIQNFKDNKLSAVAAYTLDENQIARLKKTFVASGVPENSVYTRDH